MINCKEQLWLTLYQFLLYGFFFILKIVFILCNFSGGTDPSISADVLASYNITEENCANYHEKIAEALQILPDLARKGVSEGR